MLTNLDTLETVGQDLDEARAKLEEARLALQAHWTPNQPREAISNR